MPDFPLKTLSNSNGIFNRIIETLNSLDGMTGGTGVGVSRSNSNTVISHLTQPPQQPHILGRIITSGPTGKEADLTGALYWIQEVVLAVNPVTGSASYIMPVLTQPSNYNPKFDTTNKTNDTTGVINYIWPAFNIADQTINGSIVTETHNLTAGSYVELSARSVINPDGNDIWIYVMSSGGGGGGSCGCQYQNQISNYMVSQNACGCSFLRSHNLLV